MAPQHRNARHASLPKISARPIGLVAVQNAVLDGQGTQAQDAAAESQVVVALASYVEPVWIGEASISADNRWEPGPLTVRLLDSTRAGEAARAQVDGSEQRPVILRGLHHFMR